MKKLFENFINYKSRVAFIDENNKKYYYYDILNCKKKIEKLIIKDSIVFLLAGNNPGSLLSYTSLMLCKCTIILGDYSFENSYVDKILDNFNPDFILMPSEFKKLKNYKKIKFKINNYYCYENINKKNVKINPLNKLILSTSGTSQSPKFVRLSMENIYDNTQAIIKYLFINSNHTTITTMPFGYSYGLSIINSHLHSGSKIFLNNKSIIEKEFWNNFIKYKINSFGGVPAFYKLLQKLNFKYKKFKHLKYFTQAGGNLDINVKKYFLEYAIKNNISFFIMYGQTEASPRISYFLLNKNPKKINSIGKPISNGRLKILNNYSKEIDYPNKFGELIYHGKNVSLGYAQNLKDLIKGDENKKKLKTGDLGFRDKDGFYYITSRIKRISKFFGFRIDLDDIEIFFKKKNIALNCEIYDEKLKLNVHKKFSEKKIKSIIFKEFKINPNYIEISFFGKKTKYNSFKEA